jgi:hypothetical protein
MLKELLLDFNSFLLLEFIGLFTSNKFDFYILI